ncbi:glycosyl transferase family 1 [Mycobacterium sp. ITM-2017-0098]|nr:glycosyl transferase family 1 [Mycobacterium sp. ITM-2017-0098]
MPKFDVAITVDHLVQRGGAERVVLALARAFPGAPIYTTVYEPEATYPEFNQLDIRTSWLNRLTVLRKSHRLTLPLLAAVIGRTKINAKCTIATSAGWGHGYPTTGAKIVYCFTPARWLYQSDAYLGSAKLSFKRFALSLLSPFLKRWDVKQAATATKYFAISTAVRQRTKDAYNIDAEVLPAPHSIDVSLPQEPIELSGLPGAEGGYYLCIARLLAYKNVDVIIEAMNSLGLPLVVVGAGPEENRLRVLAGPSVLMVKDITDAQLRWLYAHCTAVLAASYEDFGLTPIEAAAYGKPSIVLRWGGFLDTILEGETGAYFDQPTTELVCEAVIESRRRTWDATAIKRQADQFTEKHFISRLVEEILRLT